MHVHLHDLTFHDEDEREIRPEAWAGRPTLLVFLRWLGWLPCRDHLAQLRERETDLARLDARVTAVTFESHRRIAEFQAEDRLPYPILRDPRREGYRRFGLGREGLTTVWGPETLLYYGRRLLQGQPPRRMLGDAFQLGGDVILRADLSGGWVYRSRNPADRPDVDRLLELLRRA